jgi:hypothetical protein
MNEPMLVFETDPQTGTPKLRAVNGAAAFWSPKELSQLEDQLGPRYDGLVREGGGTLEFKGRTLLVKKKDGDGSRQPTLELRKAEFVPQAAGLDSPEPRPELEAIAGWGAGFLAEIDRMLGSPECLTLSAVEKAMLRLARDELGGVVGKNRPEETALLMFTAVLMMAEHQSRTERPDDPQPYTFALKGVESLLSLPPGQAQTPWGRLPATPNRGTPPAWLHRLWGRLSTSML